jgi:hypothetical protein
MTGVGWIHMAQALTLPTFALAALFATVAAFIKIMPQMRSLQGASDASLREALLNRVGRLETRITELERLLAREQATHSAEIADLQHDLANEIAVVDAFILLAEANPDKVLEQVPKIKEMRQRHKERMAMKRGVREGAAAQEAAA